MKKYLFLAGMLIAAFYVFRFVTSWISPVNEDGYWNAEHCIFDDGNKKQIVLTSMGNQFEVDYVENISEKCVAPYFPGIYVKTSAQHNKWILLTNNDHFERSPLHSDPVLTTQLFAGIDQAKAKGDEDLADKLLHEYFKQGHNIFYSSEEGCFSIYFEQYMFWSMGSLHRKIDLYAVQVDLEEKTIHCVGGISWGYYVSWWNLRPKMILPTPLSEQDWQNDFEMLSQKQFKEYQTV